MDEPNQKTRLNWIGGEEREPAGRIYVAKFNPVTGEKAYDVTDSEFLDVVHAVAAANRSLGEWQKASAYERAAILRKLANLIVANSEHLAALDTFDLGIPLSWVKTNTMPAAVEVFEVYAQMVEVEAKRHEEFFRSVEQQEQNQNQLAPETQAENQALQFESFLPEGIVGLILPASEPLYELCRKLAPALAAGCCVIAKPSHRASTSAIEIAKLAVQAGLPPGVFNVICGRGVQAGAALVQHPGISVLSLTGRGVTGQQLLQLTSDQFKKWQMSLNGRNPVLVFADSHWRSSMAEIVSVCFDFQRAIRGSRLFVQETIYQEFIAVLRAEIEGLIVGDPLQTAVRLGPLSSEKDKLRFQAACKQAAEERGKPVLPVDRTVNHTVDHLHSTGQAVVRPASSCSEGFFVAPQAFYDFTLCSPLQQEEVIGPFVTISSFKYQHDAIKQANTSGLGQAAYIFTSSLSKASKVASRLEAGEIYVNSRAHRDHTISWCGIKGSGLGPDGGLGLLNFFRRRTQTRVHL